MNPYQQAMFFLTYVKGTNVNEWVMAVNQWLNRQLQGGIPTTDEWLWNEVTALFSWWFTNNLKKENTQSILRGGLKMKGEDIDAYIAEFEELVQMAGYQFDVPQMIETFTEGLPMGLYQKTLEMDWPGTYEQWKDAAIQRQQLYIHLKVWLNMHKNCNTPQTCRGGWMPRGQLTNPNAMDTSVGRTRGRIMGSEEINFNAPPNSPRGGRGGGQGHPRRDLSEVECYMCHQKGHLSHNCLQHIWNKGKSWGREAIINDQSVINEEVMIAQGSTHTLQQQADAWLRSMANEGEDMQELVMRDLVGKEDFQGAWTHWPGWGQFTNLIL